MHHIITLCHRKDLLNMAIVRNIDDINISVIPVITESGAMDIIRPSYISTSTYLKYQNLQIYIHKSIPHLIHSIDAVSFEDAWRYMVDAHTGDVIDKLPLIYEEGPAIGSGINLLSETVDTLYVYEGSGFTTIKANVPVLVDLVPSSSLTHVSSLPILPSAWTTFGSIAIVPPTGNGRSNPSATTGDSSSWRPTECPKNLD